MSDIWIKASTTGTTRWKKATKISIKRASATWSAAKNIWIKNGPNAWLRVWPLSGVFATTDPFITTTASGSTPLYFDGNPIRIGTTYYGRNGTWDPNGWTISSYSYAWPYYSSDTVNEIDQLGTLASGTYVTPSNALTISSAADATATDGKYISFKITAVASNTAYNGIADSQSTYGRLRVIRRTPLNISASLTGTPAVGQVLTYASSWNTTEAYKINTSRSTIKWYKSTSDTNIYSGGVRTEITRASGSYTLTIQSTDNLDGYYVIAEETVYNTGSDYAIGVDLATNGQNQITKVTTTAVTTPYVFTFGNTLYVGTNGYIALDSGNNSDAISSTLGRVLGIFPQDLSQTNATSIWYWSDTSEFRIRWEGNVLNSASALRQYEVIFYKDLGYARVYAINVITGTGGVQAFVKNGVALTNYPSALVTGSAYTVNFDGTTAPTTFAGYTAKNKSVMKQVTALTSGTLDIGHTSIVTSTNQYVVPVLGAFDVATFTKGIVSSSSQGAARSTVITWGASTDATRYEIQYQGSSDNINWTTVQTYGQSLYILSTSTLTDSKTWATTGGNFSYYPYMRANIRASESTATATVVYSNTGSYFAATGTAPGQPTFGTIIKLATTASIPVTAGSQGTNYIYQVMEYMYRTDAGTYPTTWSTQALTTGSGTIPLSLLSGGVKYWIKIRNRNYDELYSTEAETNFTTVTAPTLLTGVKRSLNTGVTFTNSSTTLYVSTNGYVAYGNNTPGSISIPAVGNVLNIFGPLDLSQTNTSGTTVQVASKNTASYFMINWTGRYLGSSTETLRYEARFYWNSDLVEVYSITNNLTAAHYQSDNAFYAAGVVTKTWATNSTDIASWTLEPTTTLAGAPTATDDGYTAVTATKPLPNLTTNPVYGTATSASGGWTASITTAASPTGGTYSVVSQDNGSASINSTTGALTASGLTASQTSTVTVRYSATGYNAYDFTKSGTASAAASNPTVTSTSSIPLGNIGTQYTSASSNFTGSIDDGYWTFTLPFTTKFNGTNYTTIYVGTNSYITFGSGSTAYSGLGASSPANDKVMVYAGDRGSNSVYFYSTGATGVWNIKLNCSLGTSGGTDIQWEIYSSQGTSSAVDVTIVSGSAGTTMAASSSTSFSSLGGNGTAWRITSQ